MSTVYERVGGSGAVPAAVELFYTKVVGDATLAPFFEDAPMARQREKMTALLTSVTGGPDAYGGRDMRTAHAPLVAMGLDDAHFDAVVGHLRGGRCRRDCRGRRCRGSPGRSSWPVDTATGGRA